MPKASHYTIILLKASATGWEAEDRLCGVTDLPPADSSMVSITESIYESTELGGLRSDMGLVLCGPSDASQRCAKVLAASSETKIKVIEELGEVDLGLWEGVLRGDLEDRFPSVYAQWIAQPGTVAPPDGESLEAVQERILGQLFKSLRKIKSEHPIVGLVLNPYAWAVLKCWLDQRPLSNVWDYLENEPQPESFSLDRDVVEAHRARKSRIA